MLLILGNTVADLLTSKSVRWNGIEIQKEWSPPLLGNKTIFIWHRVVMLLLEPFYLSEISFATSLCHSSPIWLRFQYLVMVWAPGLLLRHKHHEPLRVLSLQISNSPLHNGGKKLLQIPSLYPFVLFPPAQLVFCPRENWKRPVPPLTSYSVLSPCLPLHKSQKLGQRKPVWKACKEV